MVLDLRVSCDDGRKEMLEVAKLLDMYGLKGIFYIAPFESACNLTGRDIKDLASRHEIGGHTLNHTRLTEVDIEKAEMEIVEGKKELEEIIERKIYKFAFPRGWYSDALKLLVRSAGFTEARTMKMGVINLDGYDKFETPVSAQNYPREEYFGDIYKGIINKFNEAKKEGNYFNLVIHTDDILKFKQWEMIDKVFKYISKNK